MNARRFLIAAGVLAVLAGGWLAVRSLPRRGGEARGAELVPGDDALGFSAAFGRELKAVGQISPEQFGERYPDAKYLEKLSWDPTTGTFYDRFQLDPDDKGSRVRLRGDEETQAREYARSAGKPLPENQPVYVSAAGGRDFRLDGAEKALFRKNGFVVSERLGSATCIDTFYQLYKRDLPVFVSSDAVLHAWHRSYDALLEEVELRMLVPALGEILEKMAARVPDAKAAYGRGPLAQSVEDADYFLAVARSLLRGAKTPGALTPDDRLTGTLDACARLQLQRFDLFGRKRDVDFSQFQPRGHYEKSEELRRYFRAMMWCGRIDLRVAGGDEGLSAARELGAAVVLHDLLVRSGQFTKWRQFDRVVQTFVGRPDSMTFAQLDVLLKANGVAPATLKGDDDLADLQRRVLSTKLGEQEYRGDVFVSDSVSPKQVILPRSFTFLGQRFTIDNWVTAKVVFDDVLWDEKKVARRVPSCLDVGFAVFGNDHATPTLVRRMTTPGRLFRDGLNYQHNLAAARNVIDSRPAMWDENLYAGWLGSLRELSRPTVADTYPESMRTSAWASKTLNTQFASWSQLRHDTILYTKQSYTGKASCYYPAGYVEPVPHFWGRLEKMAGSAARQIDDSPYPDAKVRQKHADFLRRFAGTTATLRAIATKQLASKELTKEETKFLEDVVEEKHVRVGSGGERVYAGWYPNLFYGGQNDAKTWDALVADVHTDVPSPDHGDPGCVLHQGVGGVDLLLIAVDSGKDRMVFAGPVLSHYEFEMPGVTRKADSAWKDDLRNGRVPPRPEWTRHYLVPGGADAPKDD